MSQIFYLLHFFAFFIFGLLFTFWAFFLIRFILQHQAFLPSSPRIGSFSNETFELLLAFGVKNGGRILLDAQLLSSSVFQAAVELDFHVFLTTAFLIGVTY